MLHVIFCTSPRINPWKFDEKQLTIQEFEKKNQNSLIHQYSIQKLWGFFCIICKNVRLKLLVGNYMTQLVWISEMKKQFSVNATSMTKTSILQIFTDFCKIVKICPGAQKWVGAHTSLGPNELGRWDPNVS